MAPPAKKRKRSEPSLDDKEMGIGASMTECPFAIEFPSWDTIKARDKKRKSVNASEIDQDNLEVAHNPFQSNLRMTYVVRPQNLWQNNKKYRNFVVGTVTFGVNDYILVNHAPIAAGVNLDTSDERNFWVARVLEVRALDPQHVYLRVFWLYWPEELPAGREEYHGKHELVASNHMEIIDAMTVAGRADVRHWVENDNDELLTGLYWRQTLHCFRGTISKLLGRCVCKRPANPDKVLIGCPEKNCGIWFHEECIIDHVLTKVYERLSKRPELNATHKKPTKRKSGASTTSKSSKAPYDGKFEARMVKGGETDSQLQITITDLRKDGVKPSTWEEDVTCLVCNIEIN